jgi:preprotein translocase subunit SecG
MKKILIFVSLFLITIVIMSSCKSSSSCAAYGEAHKYQKEVKY